MSQICAINFSSFLDMTKMRNGLANGPQLATRNQYIKRATMTVNSFKAFSSFLNIASRLA